MEKERSTPEVKVNSSNVSEPFSEECNGKTDDLSGLSQEGSIQCDDCKTEDTQTSVGEVVAGSNLIEQSKVEEGPHDHNPDINLKMSALNCKPALCDPCKENNLEVTSFAFCEDCQEFFCENCTTVHRSQKATRQHVLNENLLPQEALFLCDTCFFTSTKTPATASCRECEELYCIPCTNVHTTQKATRTHNILSHPDLPQKFMCEPCGFSGKDTKQAAYVCIDCDEVLCHDCRTVHVKQKITRNHTVLDSQMKNSMLCKPCFDIGKEISPDKYCKVCFQMLCPKCADEHRQDSATGNHKLQDISKGQDAKDGETGPKFNVVKATQNSEVPGRNEKTFEKEVLKPGKPGVVGQVYVDMICLAWDPPGKVYENHSFQLRYKEITENAKWKFYPELTASSTITLNNLKSDTQYQFQVRMVNDEMEGPYSDISDKVETIQSAAQRLMDFMYDVKKSDVNIPLKKLPLQENINTRNEEAKTRKLYLGNKSKTHSRERTILLVGATGTGKSTLVDGMINYIFGVNWNDPYRLTLVDLEEDEKNRGDDQAVSQTQWITCYTIHPLKGSRLDYTLNIIDTPGFGDTSGIDRDKKIIEQITTLFSSDDERGIIFIDAVCFLIKAPDARLTPTQMYIFNAIMSLFGQDIEHNFCMLVTFADGKCPPVLSALKAASLPHEQYFPFNNSGLFADNVGENVSSFSSMFWDMGCKSFEMFFDKLTMMETKSLNQTRDVLQQREVIEITMENLLPKLDAGLIKVEEMRVEIRILEDYKTQIEENSDFTYSVNETEQKQIDLPKGHHVTNCLNCHITCHKQCRIPNDEDKKRCCAMDRDGYCTQCSDNCFWNIHRNTPYIFEYVTVKKQKTYTEKLAKYRRAEGETMTRQKVVERMYEELNDLEDDIMELMEKINVCNNILRQIALRPDPLSVLEHIDLLIESERLEKRPGFHARISSLKQCRKKATVCDDVDRFRTSLTDTTKIITATVNLPKKTEKKKRWGNFSFFRPVMNYFKK